jgi:type II secretory pathway pseudopilin PulG
MLQNLQKNNNTVDTASLPRLAFLRLLKYRKAGKKRNCLKNQQGFTLVELLVAVSLIIIGIFAVLGMQLAAMRADSMAQQVLEDIMSYDSTDSRVTGSDGGPFSYFPDSAHPANNYVTIPGAGIYTTTFTRTAGTSLNGIPTGVTRIVVRITYANNFTVTITGFKRMV